MSTLTDRFSTRRLTFRRQAGNAIDDYVEKTSGGNTLMYTATVSYLILSVYTVSAWPQYYWLLHNSVMFIMFPIQYLFFRKDGNHYFFMEFCYSVNYYGMIVTFAALFQRYFPSDNPNIITNCLAFMNSTTAMRGFFLLATGPVLIATKLFGFAIFFHDLREVCSCWMHFSPAVVAYTFRWHSEELHSSFPGVFKFDANEPLSYWGLGDVFFASVYYLVAWALPFYAILWMIKDRLARKGYKTLIHFVCEGDMLKSFPVEQRPAIYIVGHFIGSILAMVGSILWLKSKLAHKAFLYLLFFSMINAGGHHYYDVYFEKLKKQPNLNSKVRQSMYQVGTGPAELINQKIE